MDRDDIRDGMNFALGRLGRALRGKLGGVIIRKLEGTLHAPFTAHILAVADLLTG